MAELASCKVKNTATSTTAPTCSSSQRAEGRGFLRTGHGHDRGRPDGRSCVRRLNARGGATITVRNEFSTHADFTAGFTAGSSSAVTVELARVPLNRRGRDPQEFVIKFSRRTTPTPTTRLCDRDGGQRSNTRSSPL